MGLFLIAFILITAVCFGVLSLFVTSRANRDDEVRTVQGPRPLIFGSLTHALAGILSVSAENRERLAKFLRQAGHYHAHALTEFLALRNALLLGTLLLVVVAIVVFTEPGEPAMFEWIGGGVILMILVYALPRLVLEMRATNRVRRIEGALPDALDMVTMCTSAGLPLQNALARVSDEMHTTHPDLAQELRLVERQAGAGSLNSAMQHFAKRIDIPELHSVSSMMWQAENQGASVSTAFHAFADQVRLTRRQRAEQAGNRAAFQMLFPLVLCLAPAVYIVLIGPAIMDLRDFFRRETQAGGLLRSTQQNINAAGTPVPNAPPAAAPAPPTPGGAP